MRRVALFSWQAESVGDRAAGRESTPAGPRLLAEIWQCPAAARLSYPAEQGWRCLACDTFVPVGKDGVIEASKTPREAAG
jgi:hypothetical protein